MCSVVSKDSRGSNHVLNTGTIHEGIVKEQEIEPIIHIVQWSLSVKGLQCQILFPSCIVLESKRRI